MSDKAVFSAPDSSGAVLRWSIDQGGAEYQEFVALHRMHAGGAVVTCSVFVPEGTPVTLLWHSQHELGVVRSCRRDSGAFLIGLELQSLHAVAYDPGALAVDDFLTEEAEEAILREIEQESNPNH